MFREMILGVIILLGVATLAITLEEEKYQLGDRVYYRWDEYGVVWEVTKIREGRSPLYRLESDEHPFPSLWSFEGDLASAEDGAPRPGAWGPARSAPFDGPSSPVDEQRP